MRKVFLAAAGVLIGLAALPAGAAPIAPLSGGASNILLAANGCGPGWYRGPYGHCHPMGGGPAYGGPVVGVGPVVVAPGWHSGYHCWWRAGVRICGY